MGRMPRSLRLHRLLFVGALATVGAGCGSDETPPRNIDPMTSAAQSAQYTGALVRTLGRALVFDTDQGLLAQLKGMLPGMSALPQPRLITSPLPAPLPLPLLDSLSDTAAVKHTTRPRFLTLMSQEESFDETAADLESFLRDRLFAPANVEADRGTEVVYLLKGDPTCRPLPGRILEGAADQVDPECAADLAKLEVRIVVRGDGDGYRFQILLGPDKHELSVFVVHTDLLAWEADLAQARKAGEFADMALGQPVADMPFASVRGRVKLAAQKLAEKTMRLSFGVLEALELTGKPEQPMVFALGKSDPAWAVTADGAAERLTVELAWPRTDVSGPWDPEDTGARNTDLHVQIGGLTGKTVLGDGAEQATITGLGMPPSFVEIRGNKIFALTLNPSSGHKLDLTVKSLPGDEARFEITPRLDLSLAFKLQAIAAELDDAPAHLLDETYALLLAGATPVVVESVPGNASGFAGGFKLVSGSLKLSTSASAAATVEVPAGKCLSENPDPAPDAHPLLGSLAAVDCP